MARFCHLFLPLEVVENIFESIPPDDVPSLVLVDRSFKRIAQPRLYKHIVLRWQNTWIFSLPPHVRLLGTVLRNPEIANLIQSVRFDQNVSQEAWEQVPPLPNHDLELVRKRLYDLRSPYADAWSHCLDLGGCQSLEVALACLLLFLPNLEAFDLNAHFDTTSSAISDLLRGILPSRSNRTPLSSLRSLKRIGYNTTYNSDTNEAVHQFREFQWFFYLPFIETIRAAVIEPHIPFSWPSHPPNASRLTALHLCNSNVQEESLERLFARAPNLKTFEYEWLCDLGFSYPSHLDCGKLGSSLLTAKSSLQALVVSLNTRGRSCNTESDNLIVGHLGSLAPFSKLRRLQIPFVVLLGWYPYQETQLVNTLPPDMFHFSCTCASDMYRWNRWRWPDEAILNQFREYFNAESSVELDTLEMFPLLTEKMQEELEIICEDAGIFYEIHRPGLEVY